MKKEIISGICMWCGAFEDKKECHQCKSNWINFNEEDWLDNNLIYLEQISQREMFFQALECRLIEDLNNGYVPHPYPNFEGWQEE